ncbi:MAG: hypothetical protein EPO07_04250 [Verrucomicrobia bacterium]|nr:MAG: hypothetical protein EPO07_04250 [Verrucomicrobiota bacterium]
MTWTCATLVAAAVFQTTARAQTSAGDDWKAKAISPVGNPIYFEDPRITSEVRPIFMQHYLPDTFKFDGGSAPLGGDVRVYAIQLRYALTEKLGLIATKDGYIDFNPANTLTPQTGFANLAAGLKYALVDDAARQLIVTPGVTIEIPTGNQDVLQGRGKGEWNVFVSAAKGWDNFHLTGNVGFRIPNDWSQQTVQAHYSLQLDYYVCQYFIPFFVANGYTVLTEGKNELLPGVALNTEMYDLINFGSTKAAGRTMITVGGGARAKVAKNVDLGVAYEAGVTDPVGIFDSRITADVIWRF